MPLMSVNPIISVLILSSSFAVHNIGVLVLLCGGIEKSVGTVWFLLMFQLLSINTWVLYTTVGLVLFGASAHNQVEGLVPVSPSLLGMATVYSLMVKGFLFGISVPMLSLAWLFLVIVTLLFSGYYVHNHGYALKHSSASQTSSHWAPVAQHLHSQHFLQSVSVSAPQSFTANIPSPCPYPGKSPTKHRLPIAPQKPRPLQSKGNYYFKVSEQVTSPIETLFSAYHR
uniref:Uncharacterized protein n=1 Tax=Oncorhynchus tshawytscha TaxID=74940 RepID=A0AAZ3SSI2_ONCTS